MIDFEYKENIQIEKEKLIELFRAVNWKTAEYPNRLYKAIKNSSYVISAYNNNELIGLLSAIDDGNINVFLTYLLIKPQYQKLGIGKKMMSDFCNHYKGFGRRILTTELDKEDYYKKFGFSIEGIAMFNKDWRNDING